MEHLTRVLDHRTTVSKLLYPMSVGIQARADQGSRLGSDNTLATTPAPFFFHQLVGAITSWCIAADAACSLAHRSRRLAHKLVVPSINLALLGHVMQCQVTD